MPRTLNEVIADLPLEQQHEIEMRAAQLIVEERLLRHPYDCQKPKKFCPDEAIEKAGKE